MLLTGKKARVLQIHATRRCNLRCTHCYSSSSPDERDFLPSTLLRSAIIDAAKLGYNVIHFSGGEPLLRTDLGALASEAHAQQLAVTLVTNGLLLSQKKAEELRDSVDLLAISLDGAPERHNRMRGAPCVFEKIRKNLQILRDTGVSFGFVFTLTRDNLNEVEWAAHFAHSEGALLFQIHPLELTGRAAYHMGDKVLLEDTAMRAWLLAQRLRQVYERQMLIEIDLTNVLAPPISAEEALQYAKECLTGTRPFAHFLSPLVLEADGQVVPVRYSFPKPFRLGSLRDHDLSELANAWIQSQALPLSELYGRVLRKARRLDSLIVNLYEWIAQTALEEQELSVQNQTNFDPFWMNAFV